jgi:O-antigen/teichoic acid export membrane protein
MSSIEAQSADRHFRIDHLTVNLRRRSLRSAAVTLTAEAVKFVLSFGSIAMLARMVAREDFGLFAMVAATLGFVMFIKDFGLSTAVQQRAEINHQQMSTLFWFNVLVSVTLAAFVAGAAPALAWFYHRPEVVGVCLAWASVPLLDGLGMQHQALLARQMRFRALASLEIGSMAIGIAAAAVAASLGAGVWALVGMQIVRSGTFLAGVWTMCAWRPSRPRRGTGVRPMLAFGGSISLCSLIDYVWRDLDKVIIGRVVGAATLGVYVNAQTLMLRPLQMISAPLGRVALPALSRLVDNRERYRAAYASSVSLMMRVMMPLILIALIWSDKLIPLVLGKSMGEDAVPFFQVLAIAAIPRPLSNVAGWLFLTHAQGGRQLRFRLATMWVSPTLFIIGAIWGGAMGVAIASACSAWLMMPPWIIYAQRGTGIGVLNMFKPAIAPLICAAAAAAIVRFAVPFGATLPVGLTLMPLLYAALLCVVAGGLAPVRELEESIAIVLKRKTG